MTNSPTALAVAPRLTSIDNDTDGRTLRRRRNRDAVIASLIALIQEGDLDPTVAKIADRANVSHRSVFRYFDDLDDLARTALEVALRDALPLAVIPGVGTGPFEDRIEGVIAARLRILSHTKLLVKVAKAKATVLPEVDRVVAQVAAMNRDQFRRHFAVELDEMEPRDRAHITALLSSQMGFEGYDHQSSVLQRTDEEISEAWRLLMRRLLV